MAMRFVSRGRAAAPHARTSEDHARSSTTSASVRCSSTLWCDTDRESETDVEAPMFDSGLGSSGWSQANPRFTEQRHAANQAGENSGLNDAHRNLVPGNKFPIAWRLLQRAEDMPTSNALASTGAGLSSRRSSVNPSSVHAKDMPTSNSLASAGAGLSSRRSSVNPSSVHAEDMPTSNSLASAGAGLSSRRLSVTPSSVHAPTSSSSAHIHCGIPSGRTSRRSATVGATVSRSSASPGASPNSSTEGASALRQANAARNAQPMFAQRLLTPVPPPFPRPPGTFVHKQRSLSVSGACE